VNFAEGVTHGQKELGAMAAFAEHRTAAESTKAATSDLCPKRRPFWLGCRRRGLISDNIGQLRAAQKPAGDVRRAERPWRDFQRLAVAAGLKNLSRTHSPFLLGGIAIVPRLGFAEKQQGMAEMVAEIAPEVRRPLFLKS
jgi:hypothetical protein